MGDAIQVRTRLRSTLVQELGGEELSEEITAESVQRTLARDHLPGVDHDALPVEGDIVGGDYKLVRRLGAGMFGRVYVAERTDVPEHRVAMKVLNRVVYAGRDVERELVMLAAAGHPNIVELKDHGVTDDYVWLTMPLYKGETLAQRLERGTLGLREAHEIFLPVARGVQALHAAGLRHQDIKPENIYLADFAGQLHPVVLDLGVAVEAQADFAAGTALFGAPEQIAALGGIGDTAELTEKVDTYCLASTLLYCLVGEKFYPGTKARTPFDIVTAFEDREDKPLHDEALPGLDGSPRKLLQESLSRWLTRDPAERPSTGELAEELDVLLEQEREAMREARRKVAGQKAALQRVRIALGALALVAASVGIYIYSKRKTIQLASELERAKAEGAASFDKLDTCIAAHELGQLKVKECAQARRQEASTHAKALTVARSEGEQSSKTIAEQLTATNAKLMTCEDDKETVTDERDALKVTLADEEAKSEEARRKLEEELEELQSSERTCRAEADKATRAQNQCRQQLAVCQSAGDPYASPGLPPAARPEPADSPYKED